MREFAVEFSVMKGLGPEWTTKTIFIGLDDLDPEIDDATIKEMAIADAKRELRRKGITRFSYRTIHET